MINILSLQNIQRLELVILVSRSPPNTFSYGLDGRFIFLYNISLRVSFLYHYLKHSNNIACTWFSELCAQLLFWWDVSIIYFHYTIIIRFGIYIYLYLWLYFLQRCEARIRHALTAEMSETFLSGGSMHASVKLEGIDGRAPQERVEHVA